MNKKFDKPLEEWIEEDVTVPVMTPKMNPKNNRIEFKQEDQIFKQKTFYSNQTPRNVVCKNHVYRCVDKKRYHFKCKHCDWNRIAPPVTFKFDEKTGILSYRDGRGRV